MIRAPARDPVFATLRATLPQTPPRKDPAGYRPASVLVPLCEVRRRVEVVLLQRSERLGAHPGQIAFPGGGRDPGEGDLACALREAEEEVGLPPTQVEVIGALDPCFTPTGFFILPFVGRVAADPSTLVPDPGEVARILRQLLELAVGRPLVAKGPVPWDRVRF